MKVGIIGLGSIAKIMAKTLAAMEEVECYAVASRTLQKANEFKEEFGFEKAYGSYEELVQDSDVDLVYIATPHSHHYENMLLCLEYNKAILCEKSFTANKKQAEEVLNLAKEKKVLVAEAIWTRYMPSRKIIDDLIASNIIGDVKVCSANLGYKINEIPRLINPDFAGGSLLDVGVYPINFASMVFKKPATAIKANATFTDSNVDETCSMTLYYPDNKVAVLYSSILAKTDRIGSIVGDKGYILVNNVNSISKIEVFNTEDVCIQSIDVKHEISGYEYQIRACLQALKNNQIECEAMPHNETLYIMETMDKIRAKIGLTYPFEN